MTKSFGVVALRTPEYRNPERIHAVGSGEAYDRRSPFGGKLWRPRKFSGSLIVKKSMKKIDLGSGYVTLTLGFWSTRHSAISEDEFDFQEHSVEHFLLV
jgi:hypothetical protein